jgi:hypothetical protein
MNPILDASYRRRVVAEQMALYLSRTSADEHLEALAAQATTAEQRRIVRLARQWKKEVRA